MIDVRLLYGGGWEAPAKPPGRRLLAAGWATLAELAHAIDLAFARWDHAHLHCFEVGDGSRYILGGHDELDPPAADSQTITLQLAGLARIGVKFTYTFDLGDDWTHACEVVAQDDPPVRTRSRSCRHGPEPSEVDDHDRRHQHVPHQHPQLKFPSSSGALAVNCGWFASAFV